MSNATNIKNSSDLTKELFKKFFEYQINEEHGIKQNYISTIKTNNIRTEIYDSVIEFINALSTERPIVVLFFKRDYPVQVNRNVHFITENDLSTYTTSSIRNCILIVCDDSEYFSKVVWDRRRNSVIRDMNPEFTFLIK
ncbi:hypothetical protein FOI42_RS03995 [Escherichia coli]|nr:hypothetical protein [Escherichia coli]MED6699473.1 hypothetical protein [Escherichia coli O157]